MLDFKQLGAIVGEAVIVHVERAVAPLQTRIGELEKTIVDIRNARPRDVRSAFQDSGGCLILTLSDGNIENVGRVRGEDGKDAVVATELLKEMIHAEVETLPPAQAGKDADADKVAALVEASLREYVDERLALSHDGERPTHDEVTALVVAEVGKAIANLPAPKDGDPGKDGKDGKDFDPEALAEVLRYALEAVPAPKDGASVTLDDVRPLIQAGIAEAVAALPPAKDGKDADPEAVALMVRDAVDALPKPKDGASVTLDDVRPLIQMGIAEAVLALEPPKDGEPGKSVTLDELRPMVLDAVAASPAWLQVAPMVEAEVARAVAALPPAKDGRDFDPALLEAAVVAHVNRAVAALPPAKDGTSVTLRDVEPMIREGIASAIAALPPAKEPTGIATALIDRSGALVITLTDGHVLNVGPVVGKDADMAELGQRIADEVAKIPRPKDGVDGKDGVSFADFVFDVGQADDRTIVLTWSNDGKAIERRIVLPLIIWRGTYKEGETYRRGDAVTWAGAVWHCQDETDEKPGDGATLWKLMVKRARDGRDGKDAAISVHNIKVDR